MKSVASVGAIADPMQRLRAASTLVKDAAAALHEARALRNTAALIAHLDHGVAPVVLYRDVLNISRGMFNRHLQRADDISVRSRQIRETPERFGTPETSVATAKRAAKDVTKYERIMDEAREIRDAAALLLMNGDLPAGVRPVSNADIAKATGLTSARVAQLRTGTR